MANQTPFRMLDKEIQRNWKKNWNNTTGLQFNKFYTHYIDRILKGDMSAGYFRNLGSNFINTDSDAFLDRAEEAGRRIAVLFECAHERLERLERKEEIKAEAAGLIAFKDLREKFPMLCVVKEKGKQVKFGMRYEPTKKGDEIDYCHLGSVVTYYCGGVWFEKKAFYSVEELRTVFNRLRACRQEQVDAIVEQHKLLEQLITESFDAVTMKI